MLICFKSVCLTYASLLEESGCKITEFIYLCKHNYTYLKGIALKYPIMRQIITHFTDNDLYTFTCQYYVSKTYPRAEVQYSFIDRNSTCYPEGFAALLQEQVDMMKNVIMDGVMCPFVINMRYYCGKGGKEPVVSAPEAMPFSAGTPAVSDVYISDVTCVNCVSAAGFIEGLPESIAERIHFSNVSVSMLPGAEERLAAMTFTCHPTASEGFFVKCARDVSFSNVSLRGVKGESLRLLGNASVTWDGEHRKS